jgi:hypothetical protein
MPAFIITMGIQLFFTEIFIIYRIFKGILTILSKIIYLNI